MRTFTRDEVIGLIQKSLDCDYGYASEMADELFKARKQQWPSKTKTGKLVTKVRRKSLPDAGGVIESLGRREEEYNKPSNVRARAAWERKHEAPSTVWRGRKPKYGKKESKAAKLNKYVTYGPKYGKKESKATLAAKHLNKYVTYGPKY